MFYLLVMFESSFCFSVQAYICRFVMVYLGGYLLSNCVSAPIILARGTKLQFSDGRLGTSDWAILPFH